MFYHFVCGLLRIYFRIFNRWEISGTENMPSTGAVVLVANHISYWDPPILGCSVKRKVHFMAKEELFGLPVLKIILPHLECFPVKRGKADRNAFRTALKYLGKGEVLGVFPEGTRSKTGKMLPLEQGAALIALKAGASIVPVGLIGTRTTFPSSLRGHYRVRIGKPLEYPALYGAKVSNEELARVNNDIIQSIESLLKQG